MESPTGIEVEIGIVGVIGIVAENGVRIAIEKGVGMVDATEYFRCLILARTSS